MASVPTLDKTKLPIFLRVVGMLKLALVLSAYGALVWICHRLKLDALAVVLLSVGLMVGGYFAIERITRP